MAEDFCISSPSARWKVCLNLKMYRHLIAKYYACFSKVCICCIYHRRTVKRSHGKKCLWQNPSTHNRFDSVYLPHVLHFRPFSFLIALVHTWCLCSIYLLFLWVLLFLCCIKRLYSSLLPVATSTPYRNCKRLPPCS